MRIDRVANEFNAVTQKWYAYFTKQNKIFQMGCKKKKKSGGYKYTHSHTLGIYIQYYCLFGCILYFAYEMKFKYNL